MKHQNVDFCVKVAGRYIDTNGNKVKESKSLMDYQTAKQTAKKYGGELFAWDIYFGWEPFR